MTNALGSHLYSSHAKPPYQWGTIDGRYHADLPDQWCEIPAHISLSEPLPRAMTRDGLDIDGEMR